jgi:hypothetical protein
MLGSSFERAPNWWQSSATEPLLYAAATGLVAKFGLRACRFEPFPFDFQLPRIEPGRITLPSAEPGIASWSGEPGVELPVRYCGLTVGRFVLVPGSPTTGVAFSPTDRAEAISTMVDLGRVLAAAMLADPSDGGPVEIPWIPADDAVGCEDRRRDDFRRSVRRGRDGLE